jgi:serine/threonine protein kinase/dipeptidyl aminopeptidase/acylaminoacyl peptidase
MIIAGTKLGRYEIRSKIGEGGMGEVYRAQDTQLDRMVALKVLPVEIASDQQRLHRFLQEARAASKLKSANVAHIYEIGEVGGHHFIAMEYVEGEPLGEQIKGRQLPAAEMIRIAVQIARALEEAHSKGITHRDIKPQNIIVNSEGDVKVLDFGLAKLDTVPAATDEPPDSELATRVKTSPGVVMGTINYMSPEQALGQEVDQRTDIFSLGVVLYEMATGRLPFSGSSLTETIDRIVHTQPEAIARLNYEIPAELEVIIKKALRKNRDERYQTAKEILVDLRAVQRELEIASHLEHSVSPDSSSVSTQAPVEPSGEQQTDILTAERQAQSTAQQAAPLTNVSSAEFVAGKIRNHKAVFVVALGLCIAALAGLAFGVYKLVISNRPQASKAMQITRLTTGGRIGSALISGCASISPDGKYVVFATKEAGQTIMWLRQVSSNSLVQITQSATGQCNGTTFSPDGESVYYTFFEKKDTQGALYQVPVLGGTSRKILTNIVGAPAFSHDGKRIAFERAAPAAGESSLVVANADGGNEQQIASLKSPEFFTVLGISWSPDNKLIAAGVGTRTGDANSTVMTFPAEGGAGKTLTAQKWPRVLRVIWLNDGSGIVLTAATDVATGGTQLWFVSYPGGEVRRITNDLNAYGGVSLGLTADDSTIVTVQENHSSQLFITAPNEDSSRARQITYGGSDGLLGLAYSPDGRVIYVTQAGNNTDVFSVNTDGSSNKRLTDDAFQEAWPYATQDGRYILFITNRSGKMNIWRIDADGGNPKQLTEGTAKDDSVVASPDGRWVIFTSQRTGKHTIWKVPIEGGAPVQLSDTPSFPSLAVSPDGKSIAYLYPDEKESGRPSLALMSFDGGEPLKTFALSALGRQGPYPLLNLTGDRWTGIRWTPDGRALSYVGNTNGVSNVWNQPIDGGSPIQVTNFKADSILNFSWSHDGKQLAISHDMHTTDIVLIKDFR